MYMHISRKDTCIFHHFPSFPKKRQPPTQTPQKSGMGFFSETPEALVPPEPTGWGGWMESSNPIRQHWDIIGESRKS